MRGILSLFDRICYIPIIRDDEGAYQAEPCLLRRQIFQARHLELQAHLAQVDDISVLEQFGLEGDQRLLVEPGLVVAFEIFDGEKGLFETNACMLARDRHPRIQGAQINIGSEAAFGINAPDDHAFLLDGYPLLLCPIALETEVGVDRLRAGNLCRYMGYRGNRRVFSDQCGAQGHILLSILRRHLISQPVYSPGELCVLYNRANGRGKLHTLQSGQQGGTVSEALCGIFSQRAIYDLLKRERGVMLKEAHARYGIGTLHNPCFRIITPDEGDASRNQLEEEQASQVDIAAGVDGCAADIFGRGIAWIERLRLLAGSITHRVYGAEQRAQPGIIDLHAIRYAERIDGNQLWTQVQPCYALFMQRLEARRDLTRYIDGALQADILGVKHMLQCDAARRIGNDVDTRAIDAPIMYAQHMRGLHGAARFQRMQQLLNCLRLQSGREFDHEKPHHIICIMVVGCTGREHPSLGNGLPYTIDTTDDASIALWHACSNKK